VDAIALRQWPRIVVHERAEEDRGCRYPVEASSGSAVEPPTGDARVRAIVLLDPAVGPGFDEAALAPVKASALVVGSVDNDFMPFTFHAGRYAQLLPNVDVVRLESGEGHFVYLDECSLPLEAMGVRLCTDRPGVVRRAVHTRLRDRIVDFYTQSLRGVAPGK
jgi:predicted dienelactone hydrolase